MFDQEQPSLGERAFLFPREWSDYGIASVRYSFQPKAPHGRGSLSVFDGDKEAYLHLPFQTEEHFIASHHALRELQRVVDMALEGLIAARAQYVGQPVSKVVSVNAENLDNKPYKAHGFMVGDRVAPLSWTPEGDSRPTGKVYSIGCCGIWMYILVMWDVIPSLHGEDWPAAEVFFSGSSLQRLPQEGE